jgi:hypothetical protein
MEKLQEEQMQQAIPSSIRQKKLNTKLIPPIKPSDTSSGSNQQAAD